MLEKTNKVQKAITGFTVKPIHKLKAKPKTVSVCKVVSRLVYGVCYRTDDTWKIEVSLKNDNNHPDILLLPFTEDSYSLKGKEIVFTINPDNNGKYTKYVRSKHQATLFPGSDAILTPFRNKRIYAGHIVRVNGKLMFDMAHITDFLSISDIDKSVDKFADTPVKLY